jgi:hypothetical protein
VALAACPAAVKSGLIVSVAICSSRRPGSAPLMLCCVYCLLAQADGLEPLGPSPYGIRGARLEEHLYRGWMGRADIVGEQIRL